LCIGNRRDYTGNNGNGTMFTVKIKEGTSNATVELSIVLSEIPLN